MIVTKAGNEDNSHTFVVGSVLEDGSFVNQAGDLILTLPNTAAVRLLTVRGWKTIQASQIRPGAKLVCWYQAVATSYPGQASSQMALVITNGESGIDIPKTGAQETGLWVGVILFSCAATLCGSGIHRCKRNK